MKKSARIVLTLVFPLALACVSGVLLLIHTVQINARAKALTKEVLFSVADKQRDLLFEKLNGKFAQLQVLVASLDATDQVLGQANVLQMQKAALSSDFKRLILADSSGNALSDKGESLYIGDREYFQATLSGEDVIRYLDSTRLDNGEASFLLSVPVYSEGRVTGAVIGALDESALRDTFHENIYQSSSTVVCDGDGCVLTGDGSALLTSDAGNLFTLLEGASFNPPGLGADIVSYIRSGSEGYAEYTSGGERWVMVYLPVGYNDWSVCMAVPSHLISASLESLNVEGYLLVGAFIASAFLLALLVTMLHSRAIRESRKEHSRLMSSEEEYRISAQQSGIVILRYDTENGTLISSQGAIDHFQIPEARANAQFYHSFEKIVEDESKEDLASFRESMKRGDSSGSAEICLRSAEGQPRWYTFEFSAIGDGGGRSTQAIVSIRDVTAQHERMAAYKRWQSVMVASIGKFAAMIEINISTGVCERAEGEFLELTGTDEDAIRAEVLLERFKQRKVEKADQKRFGAFVSLERLRNLAEQGVQKDETEIRLSADGSTPRLCLVSAQMACFPKTNEIKAFLTVKDLDDCSLEMEQLSNLALYDELSGLLNRTAARNAMEEALRFGGGERVALFMIDADNFKLLNDTLGHQHGDQAIRQISQAIKSVFRSSDIIARIGGDEFFVFLSEVPAEDFAESKASALCGALRMTYSVEDRGVLTLSASIGVVIANRDQVDYDALYFEADRALYEAKKAGKDRYCIRVLDRKEAPRTGRPKGAGYLLQMESLMQHLDGGVVLLEIGERIKPLFISDGYFMLRGVMAEAINRDTFPESVIHPNDFARISDAMRACSADGEPFQISYRNVLAEGGYGWRHMNAVRVPSIREDLPVVLAVISDITELHDATERLETVAAHSKVGIFIMRVGERLEITYFNDGALAITGFSYEQMRLFSRDASAFFRGENLKRFREEVRAANAENRMFDYLYESQGFVGKRAHKTRLHGVKLDIQNGVPSYLIILADYVEDAAQNPADHACESLV